MALYREMGDVLKQRFAGSTAWVISSNEDALKCVGLKPSKRIPMLNGDLECKFNCYEMFAGEHKDYKRDLAEGRIERRKQSVYEHHKYDSHKRFEKRDDKKGKPAGRRFADKSHGDKKGGFRRDK